MFIVKKIIDLHDINEALSVRKKVFVEEQHVPEELECDEYDASAHHFLALADNVPCGAARWRKTQAGVKLERFAVLWAYRGKGIGSALVEAVLKDIRSMGLDHYVYLHAQLGAMSLYEKFGFVPSGPLFEEAGIAHYKMFLPQPERANPGHDNPVS